MIKKDNLELVEVEIDGQKATLTFLDEQDSVIHSVNFNKQKYVDNKWVDDAEKAAKIEKHCNDLFSCSFDELPTKVGVRKTVFVYDNFSSLFEVSEVCKFTDDMKGEIFQTEIKEIIVDSYHIRIRYEIEGKLYESKQTTGQYLEGKKQWFRDPQREAREIKKFEEKYDCKITEADSLVGLPIIVEVRQAFGQNFWGDIKKPKRK